jgi:hypothetical protein
MLDKERQSHRSTKHQYETFQKTQQHTTRTLSQQESRVLELETSRQNDRRKITTLENTFKEQMAEIIKNTPIINTQDEDCLCWKLTPTGKCNSKSAYRVCLQKLFEQGEPRPRQVSANTKHLLQSI